MPVRLETYTRGGLAEGDIGVIVGLRVVVKAGCWWPVVLWPLVVWFESAWRTISSPAQANGAANGAPYATGRVSGSWIPSWDLFVPHGRGRKSLAGGRCWMEGFELSALIFSKEALVECFAPGMWFVDTRHRM